MSRWRRVAWGALALVVVLTAAAGVLLGTEAGARFVVNRVLPDSARVGAVEGRLWGPLTLRDVRVVSPGAEVAVDRVTVEWRPLRLLGRTVDLTRLTVDSATVRLRATDATDAPAADSAGPGITRPSVGVAVLLREASVRQLRVVTAAADTVTVTGIAVAATAREDRFGLDSLRIGDVAFRGHQLSLTASGRVVTGAAADRDTADLELDWSGRLADGRRIAGSGSVSGGSGRYGIDHRLSAPVPATLSASVRHAWSADSLRWELTAEVPRFALSALADSVAGEVEGTVTATGRIDSVAATLAVRGRHPAVGEVAVDGRGGYAGGVAIVDTVAIRRIGAPGEITAAGRIEVGDSLAGELELAWRALAWPLDSARVESPEGRARLAGRLDAFVADVTAVLARPGQPLGEWTVYAEGGYADTLAVTLSWSGTPPDLPRLRGAGRLRYAADRLVVPELDARIGEGPGRVVLSADVALGPVIRGRAGLRWTDVAWPQQGHPDGFSSPRGRVEASGSLDDFSVTAGADFTGWSAPPSRLDVSLQGAADTSRVDVRVQGTGQAEGMPAVAFESRGSYGIPDRRVRLDTVDLRLPETGGRLAGRGTVELAGPRPGAEGRLRWRDLGWPFHDPAYWSDEGEADVATADGEVRVAAGGHFGGTGLPDARLRLVGAGNPAGRFVVDTVRARLLGGEIVGAGEVRSDSGPAWSLALRGDSLDPGRWRAEWPGRLSFELTTDGRMTGAGPEYSVRLDRLDGTLRDRPLSAAAVVAGTVGGGPTGGTGGSRGSGESHGARVTLSVDTVWVRSAGSTVEGSGTVGDTLDVRWRVVAESLTDLVPDVVGRLTASGRAVGPLRTPRVTLDAEGAGISAAGWSVDRLAARGDVDAGGAPSSLDVTLSRVVGPQLALDSLTVAGEGTRSSHTLAATLSGPDDVAEIRLAGGFEAPVWAGRLEGLDLRSAVAGTWRLEAASPLVLGPDSGAIAGLCWAGPGRLCLDAAWSPDGARWSGTGRSLPLAFLGPALPRSVELRGEFRLDTEGTAAAGQPPRGTLHLAGDSGAVLYTRDIGQTATQAFDGFDIEARSDPSGIDASVGLRLGALGSVDATVRLPGAGPVADRAIEGRIDAALVDSGTVSRFVPALAESRGQLTAGLDLAGTVRAPELDGQVEVDSVSAVVVPAGIRLREGRLVARGTRSGRWSLEGGVSSDPGRLELAGSVRPPGPDSAVRLDLQIEGTDFRAFQTPELLLSASPRLRVQASPDSIRVDGEVRVPRARIAVRRLESTVRESPDVVIVGAEAPPAGDSMTTPAAVRADVRLVLGDSVTLDALGVTGRLTGQLAVRAEPMRPPVGSGELNVVDGSYRIYRQTFRIDRGRLLYAGTPLTNPALDLRITRRRGSVLAGMDVTGRANDPRVQLFSEPTLSDDEVLAYLIIGRPIRRLSQSEGSQVQNVAESIGVAGGNLVLARLTSVFGLEQARLERTTTTTTDGNGQRTRRETSLVLGRQILPRVHLDYVIGLTGSTNILRLRYMINDHWILQTENGDEAGADLLYSIEW